LIDLAFRTAPTLLLHSPSASTGLHHYSRKLNRWKHNTRSWCDNSSSRIDDC
jgi:hypothetical protein